MNVTRLLLLEDDATSQAWLHAALRPLGVRVDLASTCAQAAELACAAHSLWLFDAHLPDGFGAELLMRLRARGLGVGALALTAEADSLRTALLAAGFIEVLAKPIDGATLRNAVGRHLSHIDEDATWDDARALQALNGNRAAMQSLRTLFLQELPVQLARVHEALARADTATARAELHRLKASCGFVGARRLAQAVAELHAEPDVEDRLAHFLSAGAQQLAVR